MLPKYLKKSEKTFIFQILKIKILNLQPNLLEIQNKFGFFKNFFVIACSFFIKRPQNNPIDRLGFGQKCMVTAVSFRLVRKFPALDFSRLSGGLWP